MKKSLTVFGTLMTCVMGLVAFGGVPGASAVPQGAADTKPTIFVCGDSTSKFGGGETLTSEMQGWGTPIAKFFDAEKVRINNVGQAGTSSRSYYGGNWPRVLPQIKKGDYVLIVFGINDGTTMDGIGDETRPVAAGRGGGARGGRGAPGAATGTAPAVATAPATAPATAVASAPANVEHTYGWYMRKMATEAMEKGAHPYYLTVTTRNMWTNSNPAIKYKDATSVAADGNTPKPLPADYDPKLDRIERGTGDARFTNYTKQVGEMIHVPVFDLTNACADVYEQMGREATNKFYRDHNHTYAAGAENVATVIATGLKGFKDSPFVGLMNEKGKALPQPNMKYVFDNLPATSAPAAK